jgi:ArsR family transcriptional regulator, arsenate/arsenite/antimonite-responsive transcriptional repressor
MSRGGGPSGGRGAPPHRGTALVIGAEPTAASCCAPLGAPSMTDEEVTATAALFKALADPQRVRIVNLLAGSSEPVCVCDLTAPLGISQPTVSHHLKKLVVAGLLDRAQRGTWAYYSLNRDALRRLADVADLHLHGGS